MNYIDDIFVIDILLFLKHTLFHYLLHYLGELST